MHLLFAASLVLQLFLATHAYRHGRVSPWMWIILCFPFVGSLLYAMNFLVPEMRRSMRRSSARPRPSELRIRRVTPGPFAIKGDRPDNAIPVSSTAEIEPRIRREDCPDCGQSLDLETHRAETLAGRRLRVVLTQCRGCGAMPVRYFEIQPKAAIH